MKKTITLLATFFILMIQVLPVQASAPYTTWAWGPGGWMVETQSAYDPYAEIALDVNAPEDFAITDDGTIYIADTGNHRIVKVVDFKIVATYGEEYLQGPTGIAVDDDGVMYIADAKMNTVVILDRNGELIRSFGKPDEPLFGKSREFLPRKIAIDIRKNIYVVSEGSVNGIVQMNVDGNFIGYFGANMASMSLKMILQRIFLTKEQLEQFIKNEAASPSNLTVDDQSLVYTITAGTDRFKTIRKFNIAGKNIYPDTYGSKSVRDIAVSDDGIVLTVDATGRIFEYDSSGMILFHFGATDTGEQRLGTLRNPVAIDRFENMVYILDKDKNSLVLYRSTAFADEVHEGVRLYTEGLYDQAKPYFEKVLDYNGSFIISYFAIANGYYQERDFAKSLEYFRYGENRAGVSQSFWELRNVYIQENLTNFILLLFGLWIFSIVFRKFNKKYRWTRPVEALRDKVLKIKRVDDFVFLFRFIKHPIDSFYYIKKKLRGSLLFAGILYLAVVLTRILSLYVTSFIFSPYNDLSQIRLENEITLVVGLIVLFNVSNYLIATISDGEGRVRDVFIGTAYSLFPYILFMLPIALISNGLTYNEVFIYEFSQQMVWLWTGIMIFLMVKEVHNYTISETVRNLLLTIFTMLLIVLVGYILYILLNQLYDFVSAIIQEVSLRG